MTAAASCDRNIPAAECLFDHIRPHLIDARPVEPDSPDFTHAYDARCPAHDDRHRSLRVSVGRNCLYIKCYAECDELAVRAALIRGGAAARCLPITQRRKADLIEQLDGVMTNPDLEHGHKVLLAAAHLQGMATLPRGNRLVRLATEVGVARASAFRYKGAEGASRTSGSYARETKLVKPRRSPQQIVPQQKSHGETKSHDETPEGLTVRPQRKRRPAA